eukprot:scaffold88039_cov40-Prasinocladus_malaysianus.AAC.1
MPVGPTAQNHVYTLFAKGKHSRLLEGRSGRDKEIQTSFNCLHAAVVIELHSGKGPLWTSHTLGRRRPSCPSEGQLFNSPNGSMS